MPHILLDNMNFECALRLFVAGVCGALVGIERTHRNKGAGIKTHVFVAIGAALFVIISKYGFADYVFIENTGVDVSRVAANIVSGVSFLGAGIIFLRGGSVHGLTTAAGVWVTAAIGMAVGAGMYILGGVGTLMVLLVQYFMHKGLLSDMGNVVTSKIVVSMNDDPKEFADLQSMLKSRNIEIYGSHIKRHKDNSLTYSLDVKIPPNLSTRELLALIKESSNIKSIGF
ncbi:putative Mg2+ transporter-C (MgtC) family protein [Pseudobutyrivibrio sp. YE44]|uniref:MgtC/SapB family protein n=1 Tax=Pseudobutyrivibrio sp. YE44 TaxID=1520802 RepID=UPI0008836021|nr:MgtC/SapB family protein [Pseudobutyrivibrio sp. YE44]SDB05439.1 putative Mg2+ transporter-C (MgtC) family protein [Pseudobutyrivibrio sp. YE44]